MKVLSLFVMLMVAAGLVLIGRQYMRSDPTSLLYQDQVTEPVVTEQTMVAQPAVQARPDSVIHQAPFMVQAPAANWTPFYEEMCEEASLIIAWRYWQHDQTNYLDTATADTWLQEVSLYERNNLGTDISTPIAQSKQVLTDYYQLPETAVNPETITSGDDLKELLSKGVIIAPFAGQMLHNPYFQGVGPRYHMLVILGYDQGQFIVHDVGTKRGAYYHYQIDTLVSALHDFVPTPGDINTGSKTVLLVTR